MPKDTGQFRCKSTDFAFAKQPINPFVLFSLIGIAAVIIVFVVSDDHGLTDFLSRCQSLARQQKGSYLVAFNDLGRSGGFKTVKDSES
ncbi:hypothetical protein KQX54_001333 [Cotesia glomerata]|uniref:Uncharacterized protein n=1 Tax=Cotesia glomerata TaxID=32391 RepID=A0AAV7IEP9_COTGL|nr:hypothetical protein KQX54_001333 [Cotesia glomerata]